MKHILAVIALMGTFILVDTACKPNVPPALHPIVDCVNAQRDGIIKDLIASWWPKDEGGIDVGKIRDDAIGHGIQIGGCAFAQFVQKYLAPPAGTAVPPADRALAVKEAFEKYRNEHANNSSFKTAAGEL